MFKYFKKGLIFKLANSIQTLFNKSKGVAILARSAITQETRLQ